MLNNQESEIIQNLSEQEICELREAFNIFDKDSDGAIALDKLILLLKSLKQNLTQNEIKELAETFGNLKINFNQFLIIMAKRIEKKNIDEDKIKKAFFYVLKDHPEIFWCNAYEVQVTRFGFDLYSEIIPSSKEM